ncbi:flavin-containing monooxygenase [Streptomyces buecherae]|uniref:flavin-containing monooxygenase n=1 Tax=Streptomyces buecherae TaxID=2763006 RepID=UPI0018E0942A|nr:NAD(P)/FAD-dependent oxidoreductase [Streptomyces buecherae]
MEAVEYVETVIIGAGQQGCAVAASLQDVGREAVVLERGEIGQAWAHERWDSLLVGSGVRSIRFPGWEFVSDDPHASLSGPELAEHLRRYAAERELRIRQHTPVHKVECPPRVAVGDDVRFRTRFGTGGVIASRNLVAAVGGYAAPRIPDVAAALDPSVHQTHSRYYRNPASLPDGAVLVVGAGISGQQIADELADAGRRVFLSVGRHRAWPHRYRGRGIHEWMFAFGLYERFVTGNTGGPTVLPGLPVTAVTSGDSDLNLGTLAAKGVVLVGSTRGAEHRTLLLADNVSATVEQSARAYRQVIDTIDAGISRRGFVVPEQRPTPEVRRDHIADFGPRLDLAEHDITTVIWCTGFGPDYRVLPAEVLDERGAPLHEKGLVGAVPGLYYAGLPDGDSLASVAISASVDNGRFIAGQIHIDHVMRSGSAEPVIVA